LRRYLLGNARAGWNAARVFADKAEGESPLMLGYETRRRKVWRVRWQKKQ
jgi:hypothetical protein